MNHEETWKDARRGLRAGLIIVALFCGINAFAHGFYWLGRVDVRLTDWPRLQPYVDLVLAGVVAFMNGVLAAEGRHPATNTSYRTWLKTTPWHPGRPLPFGEPTLGIGDAAMVGVVGAFLRLVDAQNWAVPVDAMLGGYCISAAFALATTKRPEALALAWVGGAVFLNMFPPHSMQLLLVLLPAYAIAHYGVRQSLHGFPWEQESDSSSGRDGLVWPFSRLAPGAVPKLEAGRVRGYLATAAVTGWWIFCVATVARWEAPSPAGFHDGATALFAAFAALVALFRWFAYQFGVTPPISGWGRLRTGRWIVPGYDRMFVAPIVLTAVGVGATTAVALLPAVAVPAAVGALVALMLALALLLPPSKNVWRLTGQFRFVALPAGSRKRPERTAR